MDDERAAGELTEHLALRDADGATMTPREDLIRAMARYRTARREFLVALGIPASNRDPLAEFSERLVAELVGGRLADSRVAKGFDVVDPDGRKIQVRYLANPEGAWVNEHLITFDDDLDFYALAIIEALEPTAVICFARDTLAQVCAHLGKRHPQQERTLQLTRVNAKACLSDRARFAPLGVRVWRAPEWSEA